MVSIMSHNTQSNSTTRTTGKRAVRPPLRFSEQVEFIPSKFGVPVESKTPVPSINDRWGDMIEDDTATIVNDVSDRHSGLRVSFADKEAANTLLSMKTGETSPFMGSNQESGTNHITYCEPCDEFCTGCEQDPTDMEWYCQPCWKEWTDNYLSCPYGIIEYHQLKLDYSDLDSWHPSVTDDIVYAQQIETIGEKVQLIRDATLSLEDSKHKLCYNVGEYDEYAIVSRSYPSDSCGLETEPVYLITSTGTVYPIEGSQNPDNDDFNPIINEVVGNLKRILTGNNDPYSDNYYGYY